MSYSLPIRTLEHTAGRPRAELLYESFANVLMSSVPVRRSQQAVAAFGDRRPAHSSLEGRLRELSAIDLGPMGSVLLQARSIECVADIWTAFNRSSELIDRSVFGAQRIEPTQHLAPAHEAMLDTLNQFFRDRVAANQRQSFKPGIAHGRTLLDVAHILNAPTLILESCEFFMRRPQAKVTDLFLALGLHPRTAERRFASTGLSAVLIRRACALSAATQYILWSDLSLGEVANRFGYTDNAHLSNEFVRATGGLPPSLFRQVARPRTGIPVAPGRSSVV